MTDISNQDVLSAFYKVVWDLDNAATQLASQFGLTHAQFHALLVLRRYEPLSTGEVKDLTYSSNGSMTVILKNLEKMELIYRTPDPKDYRRRIVTLTEKGKKLATSLSIKNDVLFAQRFTVWKNEEKEELIKLLNIYSDKHFSNKK